MFLYMSHTYRHGHYWTHGENSHEISVVDMVAKEIVKTLDTRPAKGPHGLAIDSKRDILYASVEELPGTEGGGVIGIDLDSGHIVKQVSSGFKTHWFVMTPDGKKAYTCNKTASFVSILDLENEKMIGKIDVPGCEEPGISPDGKFAYFPTPGFQFRKNPEKPEILVIDTAQDVVVKSIELNSGAMSIHVTPQGTILVGQYTFPPSSQSNGPSGPSQSMKLAWYDPTSLELLGTAPIGFLPLTIRCSPDGKTAFQANVADGSVTVIDLGSKTVKTIEVDAARRQDKSIHVGAHGMAFIP